MPDEPVEHVSAPPRGHRVPRRHRLLFWTAVVAALAATGSGGYLAGTRYQEATAPERVVLDYLSAVARGDAAGALAYGDLPEGDQDLLTAEVLAAQLAIAPISDVSVAVAAAAGTSTTAEVRYQLGFAGGARIVEDTLQLVREGRTWRLAAVAVPVTTRMTNAVNRVTIAGAEIPFGPHLFFPGALPVSFDTDNLTLGEESRVVRFAQDGDLAEVAELSPAGAAAVGAAFDAALAACLDGTADVQTLCPLPSDARAVPGSLRGTLAQPASEVALIETQSGNDGLVRISAELTITGEYQQLDFNNQRVTQAGDLTIDLLAVCYATSPESIIWRPT